MIYNPNIFADGADKHKDGPPYGDKSFGAVDAYDNSNWPSDHASLVFSVHLRAFPTVGGNIDLRDLHGIYVETRNRYIELKNKYENKQNISHSE